MNEVLGGWSNSDKNPTLNEKVSHYLSVNQKVVQDFTLHIDSFDTEKGLFHVIVDKLRTASPESKLDIHISSIGGSVVELLELKNVIKEKFLGRTTTWLTYGSSAGAYTFLLGDKRVAYPEASMMVHNFSTLLSGKSQDIIDRVEHYKSWLHPFFIELISPYFSKSTIQDILTGRDIWMTTPELCQRGIATHVSYMGEILEAEEYLKRIGLGRGKTAKNRRKIKGRQ